MKSIIAVTSLSLALLLFPFRYAARAEDGETVTLEESVVTATRTEAAVLDAPAAVSVITREEIDKAQVKNLADLLSREPAITVRDYGPEGSLKSLSLRGATSEGVLVLVDGIRINDSRAGGVDLSLVSLQSVERIEIVRGGMSALYGADAVGGTVNIITKKEADNLLKLPFENGSYIPRDAVAVYEGGVEKEVAADPADLFDTQKVWLQFSRKLGTVDFVTSGSFTRANNGYTWDDTEFVNGQRRRINAELLGGDLYAGVSLPLSAGRFDSSGRISRYEKGAPGSLSWLSTDAAQTDTLAAWNARYAAESFFNDALTLDVKGSYRFSRLDYVNPDPYYPIDDRHATHSFILDAAQEMRAYERFTLVYGLNLGYDLVDSTKTGDHDRVSGGVFVESPIFLTDRFTLTPAARFDYYSDFPETFNFKLSGVYGISPSTSFKASVSKSYRAPTLNDLYWPYTAPVFDPVYGWFDGESGNPGVKPETGYSAEAGITAVKSGVSFDIFAFTRYMFDEIKWILSSDHVWSPENIGRSFYPGVEAGGRARISKNIWVSAGSSFIYSFVLQSDSADYTPKDDKRVPQVPVFSLDAGVEYTGTKSLFTLNGQYVGKQYTDAANTEGLSVDGYFVMNAGYTRKLSEVFSIKLAIDNLLNARYETADGYIMPPFFIRSGVEAVF